MVIFLNIIYNNLPNIYIINIFLPYIVCWILCTTITTIALKKDSIYHHVFFYAWNVTIIRMSSSAMLNSLT